MNRIVNQFGNPYFSGDAYTGAGNSRAMRGWNVSNGSADTDINSELPTLRERSRDLERNTPIGTAVINRKAENVIGSGLKLQARIKRKILGIDDNEADSWERNVEARFDMWAKDKNCDIARTSNFYEQTDIAFRSMLASGDCFALLPFKETTGVDCDLRISLYEGDYVSNPDNEMDSKYISGGIKVDKNHAPIEYYFSKTHPGSEFSIQEWVTIPAFGEKTSRRNVLHLFKPTRPGQRRGVPILSPIITIVKQLSRYSESELMAAVVTSLFTVFVKKQALVDENSLGGSYTSDNTVLTDTDQDKKNVELGSGTIIDLAEGEDVEFADPKRPNAAFEPYFLAGVKQIGAAVGIPYEILLQQFNASYSASRSALLEFWKSVVTSRDWTITNWCSPIYEEFLTEQITTGKIIAPGFLTNPLKRYAWLGSKWQGPARGMINPLPEIKASVEKINNKLSTHEDEYSQIGGGSDWESAMDRMSREDKLLESKNLVSEEVNEGVTNVSKKVV